MFRVSLFRYALFLLVPIALISTTYLYLYPIFHLCAFPATNRDAHLAFRNTLKQHLPFGTDDATKIVAPFRLLALGDPQLEGDSSIAGADAPFFPNFFKLLDDVLCINGVTHTLLQRIRHSLHDLVDLFLDDIPTILDFYRKRLDHVGNDYYLGHIYRTLHWWTNPTHVTVLGDLVGSQWINDAEFNRRGWRFWNRVFRGGERVVDSLAFDPSSESTNIWFLDGDEAWKQKIINIAGNHDIGYAGDLSEERMIRFTRVFGQANYELRFQLPSPPSTYDLTSINITTLYTLEGEDAEKTTPELRIVILNSMNLDVPASSSTLQDETYTFLNKVITRSHPVGRPAYFTLVLTHIPLYKDTGVCFDGPFFDHFDGVYNNGVKEQNHLSADASKGFLEGVFGMSGKSDVDGQGYGRRGLIVNGHDHEGCDVYHYINQTDTVSPEGEEHQPRWQTSKHEDAKARFLPGAEAIPGIREVTVRSMMGDYGGNAGLLSLWFDELTGEWQFEFTNCRLGTQHIWWVVHILDLITIIVALLYTGCTIANAFGYDVEAVLNRSLRQRSPPQKLKINGAAPNGSIFKAQDPFSPARDPRIRERKRRKTLETGGFSPTDRNGHVIAPLQM